VTVKKAGCFTLVKIFTANKIVSDVIHVVACWVGYYTGY